MTLTRRVSKLEEALSPTQLVLRWLAEAHSFGDIDPYVASLLAKDPPAAPLDRLAREAVHGARTTMPGKRSELVDAAVRSALRETVFRFELVLRINVTTHELLDREALIDVALSAQVALVSNKDKPGPKDEEWLGQLRDLLLSRVDELHSAGEARTLVEERYIDGHGALFPDLAAAWTKQIRSTELMAAMTVRLAELDGVAPPPDLDHEPREQEVSIRSRRRRRLKADVVATALGDRVSIRSRRRRRLKALLACDQARGLRVSIRSRRRRRLKAGCAPCPDWSATATFQSAADDVVG